jgi:hypothetical protein
MSPGWATIGSPQGAVNEKEPSSGPDHVETRILAESWNSFQPSARALPVGRYYRAKGLGRDEVLFVARLGAAVAHHPVARHRRRALGLLAFRP